jgi:hypothetical protein
MSPDDGRSGLHPQRRRREGDTPRRLTFGSATSRGPAPLSLPGPLRSRRRPAVRAAPTSSALPALSAQGLRTLVPPHPTPGPLLRSRVPAGRPLLAALARQSTLSRLGQRQTASPRPEPPVSCPRAAAAGRGATRRAARGRATHRYRATRRGSRPGRGPAPSRNSRKSFRFPLPSSRLL